MPDNPRRPYETPNILSDAPLDREEDQAYFHFDEFAVTLARLIADQNTQNTADHRRQRVVGGGQDHPAAPRAAPARRRPQPAGTHRTSPSWSLPTRTKTLKASSASAARCGSTPGNTPTKTSCWWRWCASSSRPWPTTALVQQSHRETARSQLPSGAMWSTPCWAGSRSRCPVWSIKPGTGEPKPTALCRKNRPARPVRRGLRPTAWRPGCTISWT